MRTFVTQLSLVETIISKRDKDVISNKVSSCAQFIESCSYRKVISRKPEEVMEDEKDKAANE
jgi:hypothetical protein